VVRVRDLGRSPDSQAAQLQVLSNTSGAGTGNGLTNLVKNMRATISRDVPPSGLSVHLAGAVAINVDQQQKSGNTDQEIQLLSILFIVALLLLVFRALLAPLVTLIPALFAVLISGPLVAEAAQHGLKVSPLAQILLIVLVLGAGTDYGLFLVFRVRENLRAGHDRRQAVVMSVERVGESITFSAGTVIAALLSLLAATFEFYSTLGIPLAIGIGVMLLAGLTLQPALLAIFGRAVFWPSKTQAGTGKTGVWSRVAANVVGHPAATLAAGVVFFGGLAIAVSANTPAGFGGNTNPPPGSDSAAGGAILSAHFPSTSSNPTSIIYRLSQPAWTDPQPLAAAQRQLAASGLFTGITGPLNPNGGQLTPAQFTGLHSLLGAPQSLPPTPPAGSTVPPIAYQLYRAEALYVSPDGRTVAFETGLKAGDASTTAAMNAVPSVRTEAATVMRSIGAVDYAVGGQAPAIYDISSISNSDLAHVIPIAIVVIGILLALVMRSLVAPLYLIASVALSYLAALGLSVLLFVEIAGDGGLVFFLPFLMFIFLLALGEDYNILVMSRIREEAQLYPLRDAVHRALIATGTTVTSAGLVLGGTFSVFAIVGAQQGSNQFRDVGAGLALGVLMDTFLVRTLLVPSTVVLLGRWNWWPSKLSRPGAEPPGAHAEDSRSPLPVQDP
jgi:putative drug exporter of the RND superfamily